MPMPRSVPMSVVRERNLLVIDQGTTSTRAILFDGEGSLLASDSVPLEQIYPQPGWVEHDPEAIWCAVLNVVKAVLDASDIALVAGIGIANQRETTVLWERATGRPVANAVVWQDRRTASLCDELRKDGLASHVEETTGLLLDPYFSATKIAWLLNEIPKLRQRAEKGDICFGTIDSWLIFKLTKGVVHATDATNASRTMLYDIAKGQWDGALLQRLDIPRTMLPQVRDCQSDYGLCAIEHFGATVPICGVAGDQQSSAFGQACFEPGMIKATYGTGCFVLVNTGTEKVRSQNRMLSTIGWQLDGEVSYALEGSIFMAGATVQWLRDALRLFDDAAQTEAMAAAADANSGVTLVPAFQGLGAPYWDAGARGALVGLSRASGSNEIIRAGLEGVAFQTVDLLSAISVDMETAKLGTPEIFRVDGGMTSNKWLMQFLADITALPVQCAAIAETTALGAAYHAGLHVGIFSSQEQLSGMWNASVTYAPRMGDKERRDRYQGWLDAVERVKSDR